MPAAPLERWAPHLLPGERICWASRVPQRAVLPVAVGVFTMMILVFAFSGSAVFFAPWCPENVPKSKCGVIQVMHWAGFAGSLAGIPVAATLVLNTLRSTRHFCYALTDRRALSMLESATTSPVVAVRLDECDLGVPFHGGNLEFWIGERLIIVFRCQSTDSALLVKRLALRGGARVRFAERRAV